VAEAETIISGVLYIRVRNPVWRQELSLLKPEFLEKYRARFGADVVKDLTFR